MTLSELSLLGGTTPKWVLNAGAVVSRPRYSIDVARQIAVARAIQAATGANLPRAWAGAGDVLARSDGSDTPVTLTTDTSASVTVLVDVRKILLEVSVRQSQLNSMHGPRQRGRRRRPTDVVKDAQAYGLDLTLLRANLSRTVTQRLRQLDGMMAFRRSVRRVAG